MDNESQNVVDVNANDETEDVESDENQANKGPSIRIHKDHSK